MKFTDNKGNCITTVFSLYNIYGNVFSNHENVNFLLNRIHLKNILQQKLVN